MSKEITLSLLDELINNGVLTQIEKDDIVSKLITGDINELQARDLIQLRRGDEDKLPYLAQGEPALCLDTHNFYMGGLEGNILISNPKQMERIGRTIDQPFVGQFKTVKEDNTYNCWPVIVKATSNRIFVFYAVGDAHKSNEHHENGEVRGRHVCYKYSDNNGLKWSDEHVLLYDKDYDFTTFGAIGVSNGNIVVFINKNEVASNGDTISSDYIVMVSNNNGETWYQSFSFRSSNNIVLNTLGYPNVPVEMDNGQLIASKNFREGGNHGLGFVISNDKGLTWDNAVIAVPATYPSLSASPWEVRLTYIGEGKLIALARSESGAARQLTSSNYGLTWEMATTNFFGSSASPMFPYYFNDTGLMVVYHYDRFSNKIMKKTVDAHFIFDNPTQYPTSEVIGYTSSRQNRIDTGYITAVRLNSDRPEMLLSLYTTRDRNGTTYDHIKTAVVVVYDSVNSNATETDITPKTENIFKNGAFSLWNYGTTHNTLASSKTHVSPFWLFELIGTGSSTVRRSTSTTFNHYTMAIEMSANGGKYRLYQPVHDIENKPLTLSTRFTSGAGNVRPFARYKVDGVFQEKYLAPVKNTVASSSLTTFTFNLPQYDIGTPVFIGLEFDYEETIFISNMKLEHGYRFTGFTNDKDRDASDLKNYYEHINGVSHFISRNDGALMATVYYSPKINLPTVKILTNDVENKAEAMDNSTVLGEIDITNVTPYRTHVRFFGSNTETLPTHYTISQFIVDARLIDL